MHAKLDPRDLLDRQLGRVTMYRLITIVLLVLAAVYVDLLGDRRHRRPVDEGPAPHPRGPAGRVLCEQPALRRDLAGSSARGVVDHHGAPAVLPLRPAARDRRHQPRLARRCGGPRQRLEVRPGVARAAHLQPRSGGRVPVLLVQDVVGRENPINAIWQTAATEKLFPFVLVGAFLVLWRTRRLDIGVLFIVHRRRADRRLSAGREHGPVVRRRAQAGLLLVPHRVPRRLHAERTADPAASPAPAAGRRRADRGRVLVSELDPHAHGHAAETSASSPSRRSSRC